MLQFQEKAFDQMTLFVNPPVTTPWVRRIAFGRDGVFATHHLNVIQNLFRAVGLISKHIAGRNVYVRQDIYRNGAVVDISGRELKINRIAQTVYNRMNFGRLSTTACTNMLVQFAI